MTWRLNQSAAVAAIASALLAAPAAFAQAFVVVVPVELSGLPEPIDQGRVSCSIYRAPAADGARGREVARGMTDFAIVGSAFSGQVRVNLVPGGYPVGVDPLPDGRNLLCNLELMYACSSSAGGLGRCTSGTGVSVSADSPAAGLFVTDPARPRVTRLDARIAAEEATLGPPLE